MNTTKRMLALARAIERLSSRDMVRVVSTVYADKSTIYDSNRYQLTLSLLKISHEHGGHIDAAAPPNPGKGGV